MVQWRIDAVPTDRRFVGEQDEVGTGFARKVRQNQAIHGWHGAGDTFAHPYKRRANQRQARAPPAQEVAFLFEGCNHTTLCHVPSDSV